MPERAEEIMALQNIRRNGAAGAAILGLGALLVGCSSRDVAGTAFAAAAAAPVSVSCEPNQRAVVRQVPVNGALQAQVQCETVGAAGSFGAAAPVAYQPGFQPVGYNAGFVPIAPQDNTRIVGTAYPQPVVTRGAAPRRVTSYQRAPERIAQPKRSVKKSAVIIGSSAGVGAGIGAAVGGKKGAGIGALIGGGGAALWDQITRRR
jgi:hypothetical protein